MQYDGTRYIIYIFSEAECIYKERSPKNSAKESCIVASSDLCNATKELDKFSLHRHLFTTILIELLHVQIMQLCKILHVN